MVLLERRGECRGVDALAKVGGDRPHAVAAESQDARGAQHRVVGLARAVDRQWSTTDAVGGRVHADLLQRPLPGGAQGDEVGHGTTARVDPLHVRRQSAELTDPVQGQLLQAMEGGQGVALG